MYQYSYAEVLEDDQASARQIEYDALDKVVGLLRTAAAASHPSREGVEALHCTRELWMVLINEVTAPANALAPELRGNIASIGIWILKEAEAIRLGRSSNYAGIADICAIIRDGLR